MDIANMIFFDEDDDDALFGEDLEVLDIIDFGFPRRIYPRSNHFHQMDELTFFQRFRLRKETVLNILINIEDQLEYASDMNNSVTPMDQLLTSLRFYASAGHLASIADFMGMHLSTASRVIQRVSRGEDAEVFRNRKTYFSVNVQVITDSRLRICDIVARWPGSTHDMTIFANSRIKARFDAREFGNAILLGDSGYALSPYLMTPILNPNTHAEQLYNESHIRTRNIVERLFGVWKRRFPVLAYGLRLQLNTVLAVIVATAVLHNIAREMNEEEPPLPINMPENQMNRLIEEGNVRIPNGNPENIHASRNEFIQYFNNL
ncbi:hypothetical protein MML48_2g00000359 [Holotrichia oblita]|uniref:Uncharacterized protein n=2 Tax=Holotrichia oblita TaxID=644536 RepID=A0ACB9TJ41_HOLOL|nr:hypothetical protein MML48_2g00018914 [Holotrichia oblita]KAI4466947.1 hypothetical protein MML48_2g00000359 [Holotrichia oblita]